MVAGFRQKIKILYIPNDNFQALHRCGRSYDTAGFGTTNLMFLTRDQLIAILERELMR
jgi:hypothetical protein